MARHGHDDQRFRLFADRHSSHDFLGLRIDGGHCAGTASRNVADLPVGTERQPIDAAADWDGGDLFWLLTGDVVDMYLAMLNVAFPDLFLVRPNSQAVAAAG